MKNSFLTAVPFLALCALTSQMALAGTQADLTIGGQILSSACDISLGNGGNFSYGDIFAKDLDKTGPTQLPFLDSTLNITCSGPRHVAINFQPNGDNRSSLVDGFRVKVFSKGNLIRISATNNLNGLGFSSDGKKIGSYALIYEGGTYIADGAPINLIGRDATNPWAMIPSGYVGITAPHASQPRLFSFGTGRVPTPITTVSGNVYVAASIADGQGLTFDNGNIVNLQGNNSTLELVYL
jgi:type 1 fimbria pilin